MVWVVMGIVLALFGVTGSIIENDRGGGGFVGFVLGFLFGPFGLIWAYYSGDQGSIEARDIKAGRLKCCPDCAEAVRRSAIICRHCGHDFSALELK